MKGFRALNYVVKGALRSLSLNLNFRFFYREVIHLTRTFQYTSQSKVLLLCLDIILHNDKIGECKMAQQKGKERSFCAQLLYPFVYISLCMFYCQAVYTIRMLRNGPIV